MGRATRRILLAVALASGLFACKKEPSGSSPGADATANAGEKAAARAGDQTGEQAAAIHWIHDDYPAALARARKEDKPLFIDFWAPWCHTCLSMKHYVLNDPGLAALAPRFVWLAIDTDRENNAAAVGRYPLDVWPTFYVVSPEDESVQARQLGAASVAQMREVLDQGEVGHLSRRAAGGKLDPSSPLAAVRTGDQAAAAGKPAEAAAAYRQALEKAPADWPRTADVAVKLVSAVARAGDVAQCQELAGKGFAWAARGNTASAVDFAAVISDCAQKIEDAAARKRALEATDAALAQVLSAPEHQLSVDDKSDGLRVAREIAVALGDKAKADERATAQRALLDEAIAQAPSAYAAMTYNWPLAEVTVYQGKAADAVPVLQKSVAALPGEYDPPARLGWVYLKLGKLDEALASAEKALALAYGPRKARVQELCADIHKARGDSDAERKAREAVVELLEKLPEGQKRPKALEAARQALAAVGQKS